MTAAALHAPVAALVQRCGAPQRVVSDERGNHFIFVSNDGALFTDVIVDADAGLARAIALWGTMPEAITATIDDHPHAFDIGVTTLAATDAELADVTVYSFGSTRVYGTPKRMIVASFDPQSGRLSEIAIGEMATLARDRLLPGRLNNPGLFAFVPPSSTQPATATGTRRTIVRIDVDANGIVRHVAIVVPSTDAAFDAALADKLGDERFVPASLEGRPSGGSVYREVVH